MRARRTFRFLLLVVVGVLVATSCSSSADVTDTATGGDAQPQADQDPAAAPTATPTPPQQPTVTPIPTTQPAPTVAEPAAEPTPLDLPPTAAAAPVGTRLCTVDVAYDEVLNVRDQPSLDGNVIARVPGLSCALTVPEDSDLDAEWLPVRYETGHVRLDGFVSNEFVDRNLDRLELVALEWAQAVLDGDDRSPWEYGPSLADVDTQPLAALRGGVAVPFVDTFGSACRLVGDVTAQCGVQVNGPGGSPIGHFHIFGSQVGNNGYEASFWPEDFGDLPLVESFRECGLFSRCDDEGIEFATIAIDSDAALGGVPLGSQADQALIDLAVFLGPPTADTDWIVGCPLDGEEELNERYVEWGGLTVAFSRWSEAPDGELWYWYYDFDSAGADPGISAQIRLPGRASGGATLDAVSESTRLPIELHELIQEPVIYGPGWTLFGEETGEATRLTRAAVPFIGICD